MKKHLENYNKRKKNRSDLFLQNLWLPRTPKVHSLLWDSVIYMYIFIVQLKPLEPFRSKPLEPFRSKMGLIVKNKTTH